MRWCAWEPGIAGSGLPDPGRSDQRTTNLDQFGTLKSRHTGRSQRIRHQHYQVPGMLTVGHCGQQFFNQVPCFKLGECSNMFKCRAQQTAVSMPKEIFVLLPPVAPKTPKVKLSVSGWWRWYIKNLTFPGLYPLVNQHNYGKTPLFMGKLTISMVIFHSYVKFPGL